MSGNLKRRSRKTSIHELVSATKQFADLLDTQKEKEAAADLRIAANDLDRYQPQSMEFRAALELIIEAFEGEHELSAYNIQRQSGEGWTDSDELYLASTKVYNLVMSLKKTQQPAKD